MESNEMDFTFRMGNLALTFDREVLKRESGRLREDQSLLTNQQYIQFETDQQSIDIIKTLLSGNELSHIDPICLINAAKLAFKLKMDGIIKKLNINGKTIDIFKINPDILSSFGYKIIKYIINSDEFSVPDEDSFFDLVYKLVKINESYIKLLQFIHLENMSLDKINIFISLVDQWADEETDETKKNLLYRYACMAAFHKNGIATAAPKEQCHQKSIHRNCSHKYNEGSLEGGIIGDPKVEKVFTSSKSEIGCPSDVSCKLLDKKWVSIIEKENPPWIEVSLKEHSLNVAAIFISIGFNRRIKHPDLKIEGFGKSGFVSLCPIVQKRIFDSHATTVITPSPMDPEVSKIRITGETGIPLVIEILEIFGDYH